VYRQVDPRSAITASIEMAALKQTGAFWQAVRTGLASLQPFDSFRTLWAFFDVVGL
jgi:hypothetical protein